KFESSDSGRRGTRNKSRSAQRTATLFTQLSRRFPIRLKPLKIAAMRKIIHIDMDAFYASVELRERPELRHLPVVIASHHPRAVVAAASYPSSEYGLDTAVSMVQSRKLCAQVIVIVPVFAKCRQVSAQIHQFFLHYSALSEPLSLDEAFLDVTENLQQLPSATGVA